MAPHGPSRVCPPCVPTADGSQGEWALPSQPLRSAFVGMYANQPADGVEGQTHVLVGLALTTSVTTQALL